MNNEFGKFGELPLIVLSSNLQFDLNNYNRKSSFGIEIKPTKNINLTLFSLAITFISLSLTLAKLK
ncbi:hypothetical protein LguiA_001892 [Lonicera macranthoides]